MVALGSTNVKMASAMIGSVMALGVIEHLCCILTGGHHDHEVPSVPGDDHAGSAANMLGRFFSKYRKAPCVKIASVEWAIEANRELSEDEIEALPEVVEGIFGKSMLHSVHAHGMGQHVMAMFEIHDGPGAPLDMSAVEASLCTAPCNDLVKKLAAHLSWTPLSLHPTVKVDASVMAGTVGASLDGRLLGPVHEAAPIQDLWLALALKGHRATVEPASATEDGAQTVVPVHIDADAEVAELLAGWTHGAWRFDALHVLPDSVPSLVLP